MQRFFKKLLSFTLALILVCGFIPLANSSAKDEEIIKNKYLDPRLESKLPLYGGYYRTWHDVTSSNGGVSNGGLVEMDKLPQGTDLVFIFDDWQDEASPFWTKLPEYVENLHNQGSLVIRTIGTEFLMGRTGLSKDKDKYPNNSEGWSRLAKDMVEKYVLDYNLDGLDLDVEGHNYNSPRFNENLHLVKEEEMQQIHGVYKELIKELKAHNKLVIYDTTLGAGEKLFQENYMDIDLVLVQAYGLAGEVGEPEYADGRFEDGIDDVWKDFSKYISSKKFMIGFSFYEENGSASGGRWFDVPTLEGKVEISNPVGLSYNREFVDGTIEDSRAGRYALWQPEGGLKGGLFSYAIERDGVGHPSKEISDRWAAAERAGETDMSPYRTSSDRKLPTEFNQSKSLIQMMEESRAYEEISLEDFPDQRFLELVKERVGKLKAEVARFNGQLVIDDPEIISLKGLEEFKNVEKISLKGLNKLETFSKDNLPESFHSKPNLEISGLEAIRQLDLSSINLSKLPFNDLEDLNKWRSIEKFDISNNKLDFSEASEDRPIFELLVNNNDLEDFIFDGQRPDSYYKKSLDTSELNISKSENMYDTRFHLEGFCTISGRQINSERDFDEFISERIFDKQYIDQDYKYEDFIAGKNYSDYKIEIRNSSQKILEGEQVPLSKDETYTVKYFTPSEALIHTLLIKVGEGKEVLTKLTVLNAYDDSGSVDAENIESAFDDDISLSSSFNSGWSAPSEDKPISIYFDLGVYKKLGALTLHQYSLLYGSTDSDISKAYLEYLEDSDFEVDKSLSYQEQVDSLRSQEWKMHAEINSLDEEKLVDKEFDLIQARYWRLRVVATKGGTMWDGIMLPELELFGVQVPEEPATVQLTFNLQGGLLKDSGENYIIEAKIGDEIEIPQGPEKEGYRFLYWKGSEYYPGDKYLVEGNHEFEAVYEKIEEVDPNEGQEPNEEIDPNEGQEPNEEVDPNEGQEPNEEVDPNEGQEPNEEVDPNEGQEPNEEVDPNEGQEPNEEIDPNEGQEPNEEIDPNEGQEPNEEIDPNEGQEPNEEVDPNEGQEPNEEVDPNEGQEPNEEVDPNEGHDPNEEVDPNEGIVPNENENLNEETDSKEDEKSNQDKLPNLIETEEKTQKPENKDDKHLPDSKEEKRPRPEKDNSKKDAGKKSDDKVVNVKENKEGIKNTSEENPSTGDLALLAPMASLLISGGLYIVTKRKNK